MITNQGVVLRHPRLSYVDLAKLLMGRIPDDQKAWYLVISITDTAFGKFEKSAAEELVHEWSQGRVFCAACEIRWRRAAGDNYNDVLLLCEDSTQKLDGFQKIGDKWLVAPPGEQAMLRAWGSPARLGIESRLPRRLHYPVECKEGRLLYLYYCAPSGEGQLLRLMGVK